MNAIRLGLGLTLGVTILLGASPDARACGGFFRESSSSEVTAMSDVRVLLVRTQDRVEQYVQVAYSGRATRFAWVYPVAANPEVTEAKDSPFASLDEQTRPHITITTVHSPSGDDGGGCGCGSGDGVGMPSARDAGAQVPPPVTVWQSGQVGAFDYVVVSATKADDLLGWLNSNGFVVPASTSGVLDHYLGLGWVFVAMKVSVASVTSGSVPSTTTIKLGYAASELRYPLRMVSLSPATELKLEIYVVSSENLAPAAPFVETTIPAGELHATSSTTHNYEALFASLAAKSRTLVREFSSRSWSPSQAKLTLSIPEPRLTRFRGVLPPTALDQDLLFKPSSATANVYNSYSLSYDPPKPTGIPLPAVVVTVVVAGLLWRRRSTRAAQRPLPRIITRGVRKMISKSVRRKEESRSREAE